MKSDDGECQGETRFREVAVGASHKRGRRTHLYLLSRKEESAASRAFP